MIANAIPIPPLPARQDGTPPEQQTAPPLAGEDTASQAGGMYVDFATPFPNGNDCNNPCGFPYYGTPYAGTYQVYRWIDQHPTIAHAKSQVFHPIQSAGVSFNSVKGTDPARVDFVKGQCEILWRRRVADALRGVGYGNAGFEKIWEVKGGQYRLADLKPLRVDTTSIFTDRHGRYAGLAPDGRSTPADVLGIHKTWLYTYDGEFGDLHGRSRHENVRATAWRDWLDTMTEMVRLTAKISGIMPIVYVPSGTHVDSAGTVHQWASTGLTMVRNMKRGNGVVVSGVTTSPAGKGFANIAGSTATGVVNMEQFLALAKFSPIRVEVIDFGSNAPAIAALLERARANEELMFAGWFLSPRTGMATQGGTKADAGQHTDTATVSAEVLAGDVAESFNAHVIDDILALNFGDEAKGTVWLEPGKLTDDNLATDNGLLTAVYNNADGLGTQFLEQVDMTALADRRGIPHGDKPITLKAIEMEPGDGDTIDGDGKDAEGAQDETDDAAQQD